MKKTLALLIIPLVTLTGCAKYDKDPDANSYFCQQVIHKMHSIPHRYKASGSNKHIATTQSRLQKEYYQYDCQRYYYKKDLKKTQPVSSSYNPIT